MQFDCLCRNQNILKNVFTPKCCEHFFYVRACVCVCARVCNVHSFTFQDSVTQQGVTCP